MFLVSLAHQQGVHSRIIQWSNTSIIPGMYVELLQVRQCMIIAMDMCTVIGVACRFECVHSTHSFRQMHYSLTRCVIGNTKKKLFTQNVTNSIKQNKEQTINNQTHFLCLRFRAS